MRIKRIEVSNFRALRNSALEVSSTTALIGENNSGKSAFLAALELFFSTAPKVRDKDFSDDNFDAPIDITVHFSNLTPYDRERFSKNLVDGALVVTRRLLRGNPKDSGNFFVSAKVNRAFSGCRSIDAKQKKLDAYKELRDSFPELEAIKKADDIDEQFEKWEQAHPEVLELDRVGSFRGFKEVAVIQLKEKTDYILIKAVQDAEEVHASKASPVKQLIDTIAKQTIENNIDFQKFMQDANQKIFEFTNPQNVPVLSQISDTLTAILNGYYRDSAIKATWKPIESIQASFPTSDLEVTDNEFVTNIDGVGHGLQRAIILTVLQFVAERRAAATSNDDKFGEAQSDIIIAIEEPEIYQHPVKQRLFAKLLRNLTKSFNEETGIRIQTIYVTHSPLLVSLIECESIRMVRSQKKDDKRNVHVRDISLDRCSQRCAYISGRKPEEAWSGPQFGAKLHTFTSEIAEGFFSKCVVLVEGVGDKAVLNAWYRQKHRDPNAEGIVIADVTGKPNLDKPIVIFEELNISCYWIYDNDKRGKAEDKEGSVKTNRLLQILAGTQPEQCVEWPEGVFPNYAAWDGTIEKYVRDTVGAQEFESVSNQMSKMWAIKPSNCIKFPASAAAMLVEFGARGHKFERLDLIVEAIDKIMAG